ncbi:MAG: hypothetical protein OXE50_16370, partial [Chloroflexi bacterium]|nr:hypothetical protein [Chloroflexota bacterium]
MRDRVQWEWDEQGPQLTLELLRDIKTQYEAPGARVPQDLSLLLDATASTINGTQREYSLSDLLEVKFSRVPRSGPIGRARPAQRAHEGTLPERLEGMLTRRMAAPAEVQRIERALATAQHRYREYQENGLLSEEGDTLWKRRIANLESELKAAERAETEEETGGFAELRKALDQMDRVEREGTPKQKMGARAAVVDQVLYLLDQDGASVLDMEQVMGVLSLARTGGSAGVYSSLDKDLAEERRVGETLQREQEEMAEREGDLGVPRPAGVGDLDTDEIRGPLLLNALPDIAARNRALVRAEDAFLRARDDLKIAKDWLGLTRSFRKQMENDASSQAIEDADRMVEEAEKNVEDVHEAYRQKGDRMTDARSRAYPLKDSELNDRLDTFGQDEPWSGRERGSGRSAKELGKDLKAFRAAGGRVRRVTPERLPGQGHFREEPVNQTLPRQPLGRSRQDSQRRAQAFLDAINGRSQAPRQESLRRAQAAVQRIPGRIDVSPMGPRVPTPGSPISLRQALGDARVVPATPQGARKVLEQTDPDLARRAAKAEAEQRESLALVKAEMTKRGGQAGATPGAGCSQRPA